MAESSGKIRLGDFGVPESEFEAWDKKVALAGMWLGFSNDVEDCLVGIRDYSYGPIYWNKDYKPEMDVRWDYYPLNS